MFSDRSIVKTCAALLAVAAISSIPAVGPAFAGPEVRFAHGTPHHPSDCQTGWVPGPFGSAFPIVTWHDNSDNEDGFIVELWRGDHQAGWTLLGTFTVPANTTSILFSTAPPYLLYGDRFRVRAFNSSGVSSWSNWGTL